MLKGRRFIATGITHGVALLIGLGGWMALRHSQSPETRRSAENTRTSQPRPNGPKSQDEVLALISEKNEESAEKKRTAQKAAAQSEFDELVKTMPVPDDLEAALSAEIGIWKPDGNPPSARIAALMYFWAARDLPGLLNWAEGTSDTPKTAALNYYLDFITARILNEKGPEYLVDSYGNPFGGDSLRNKVAETMAASPDLGKLANLKGKMVPEDWQKLRHTLGGLWSWSEKSKLVEFAISENDPKLIASLAYSQSGKAPEAGAWLLELMKDGSLDPGFRERLSKEGDLKYVALSCPTLPLEDRVVLMNAGPSNRQSKALPVTDQLANRDVDRLFSEGRDWNTEFRYGNADANEVLAEVLKKLPELAAKSPAALRDAVFLNLVEDDPVRALPLLDGLSAAERAKAMGDAAQNAFFRVDPNHFLTFLQQMPADDPQFQEARLAAWVKHAPDSYQQQDMDYVKWVRALPDGVDREMAIYSLSLATSEDQPELAAQLRTELKDGNLKDRMKGAQ